MTDFKSPSQGGSPTLSYRPMGHSHRLSPPLRQPTKAEQRRKILADLDNAEFKHAHVRTILTAGAGFFTSSYDIFAINLAAPMIGQMYATGGQLTRGQELGLKIAAPIGNLFGQIFFGWLADVVGRKKMYGVELLIILTATFGQAIAGRGPGLNIFGVLIFWRFVMGVGIGGDYPLSAVISSEFAAIRFRGRMMASVVAMQGFGNLSASIVALIVTAAFKDSIIRGNRDGTVDYLWRLVFGIGMIPAVIALYFRLTIPESPRYTMDVDRNLEQAARDADFVKDGKFDTIGNRPYHRPDVPQASRRDFVHYFAKWKNLRVLIGCAWSWFALDFAFYGLGLNPSIVFTAIGFGQTTPGVGIGHQNYRNLMNTAIGSIILSLAGFLPGYWLSFGFVDKWGRKPIQFMGFTFLTAIYVVMGFGYNRITSHSGPAFAFLYALASLFQNFGPNVTTFIIPGELFPTRYRSTSHGISAAAGKLGAILAQVLLLYAKDIGGANHSVDHILEILAFFMLTGIASTTLLPETKGKSLESLAGEEEDEDSFNGHEVPVGGFRGFLSRPPFARVFHRVSSRPRSASDPWEMTEYAR